MLARLYAEGVDKTSSLSNYLLSDSFVLAIWVVVHRGLEEEREGKKGGIGWQKEFLACFGAHTKFAGEVFLTSNFCS